MILIEIAACFLMKPINLFIFAPIYPISYIRNHNIVLVYLQTEFRRYWLHTKFEDIPEITTIARTNKVCEYDFMVHIIARLVRF